MMQWYLKTMHRKTGIPENRIKILVNDRADEECIIICTKWLRRSAKANKSDIYVFFAGHGLASQDGRICTFFHMMVPLDY